MAIMTLPVSNTAFAEPYKSDKDFSTMDHKSPDHHLPSSNPSATQPQPPNCEYASFYSKHFKEHPHNIDSCNRLMTIETTKDNTYRNQLKLLLIKAKQTHTQR